MKKAKKFKGRKILVKIDTGDTLTSYRKEMNIVCSFEDFKNDFNNNMYTSIELLQDNLILYKCDIRKTNDLATLYNIRRTWEKGIFIYDTYLTKNEIINLLKEDYLVAVQGLQEIELEDTYNLD